MRYLVHHTPGRLRVKIPDVQGNARRSRQVCDLLNGLEGVESVSCNPRTGSIVILYDETLPVAQKVFTVLKENDYYDETRVVTHDEYIQDAVNVTGKKLGKAVFGWAVGKAIEDTGFALLAALI